MFVGYGGKMPRQWPILLLAQQIFGLLACSFLLIYKLRNELIPDKMHQPSFEMNNEEDYI
jgi:hypothetical protein